MTEALVEHDYVAKEPDELTIKKGEVIKDVIKKPGGWWEGVLNDKKGLFPDNFVRLIDKESAVNYRNRKDSARIRQCRVVFSYRRDHEDELNLNVGDVIDILGEEEEGWWRGVLNGREGVFPSNFVEEIPSKSAFSSREDLNNLAGEIDTKSPSLPPKPVKVLYEVKYAYKAQNDDELTLQEGDIVTLITKEVQDPGWWKGELNGQIGVFPDNFVVAINSADDKNDSKKQTKTPQEPSAIKPSSIASQRKSLEVKPEKLETETANKTTPPVPSKKPLIPIKKSPSGSGSTPGGLFSGIKKKFADVVDGSASSKNAVVANKVNEYKAEKINNSENTAEKEFDQVERRPLLQDVRASRAKAPGRRPPSVIFKEGEPGVLNGNTDHGNLDILSEQLSNSNSSIDQEVSEAKPKLREWEKHKAPWLEEMKLNQAKRTSTSPGPEQNKLKLTPTDKTASEVDEVKPPTKTSPYENVTVDTPKSAPLINNKLKTPPNELEKTTPVMRSKPMQSTTTPTSIRPQTIHTMSSPESYISKATHPKVSPVPASNKVPSPVQKPVVTEKPSEIKASDDAITDTAIYNKLLERIQHLEETIERQNKAHAAAIEDLKEKLQVEVDMRILLQAELEKVSQCVMQV